MLHQSLDRDEPLALQVHSISISSSMTLYVPLITRLIDIGQHSRLVMPCVRSRDRPMGAGAGLEGGLIGIGSGVCAFQKITDVHEAALLGSCQSSRPCSVAA